MCVSTILYYSQFYMSDFLRIILVKFFPGNSGNLQGRCKGWLIHTGLFTLVAIPSSGEMTRSVDIPNSSGNGNEAFPVGYSFIPNPDNLASHHNSRLHKNSAYLQLLYYIHILLSECTHQHCILKSHTCTQALHCLSQTMGSGEPLRSLFSGR